MQVEPIHTGNRELAIDVLATAFADDPVINWSCNQPTSLVPFFTLTLAPFLPHGLCYLDGQARGAAVWLGPDQTLKWPVNLSGVQSVMKLGGARGVFRMLRSARMTERHHPRDRPHYYLFAIGVLPEAKGIGLGSALLRHVLRRCDDEGVPAYLENSREQNLPFYEGHGFRVQQQIRFAKSAPPVWLMWREPQLAELR